MKLKGSLSISLKPASGIKPQPVQSTSDLVEDPFSTIPYDNDNWSAIPGKGKDESLFHQVQDGSNAQLAS